MANLEIKQLEKRYANGFHAIKDINVSIADGEFIVIVGPSGCGKSTLMRMVAGLEEISSGEISIGDKIVNELEPAQRNIAMVFQNYALYPHMTVFDNMSFSLKIAKMPKDQIKQRVEEVAAILGLQSMLDRKPKQLSGGQRQRVAMGRAIVRNPQVFLFDEPLSNLDAKLRVQMRLEIQKLHKQFNTTSLYVTHDQVEAMTLADRIIILNAGRIEQIGTPDEIFDQPASVFVAEFIGLPPMNLLPVNLSATGTIQGDNYSIQLEQSLLSTVMLGKQVYLGIRPEELIVHPSGLPMRIELMETLGSEKLCHLSFNQRNYIMRYKNGQISADYKVGDEIRLWVKNNSCLRWFDIETGLKIATVDPCLSTAEA